MVLMRVFKFKLAWFLGLILIAFVLFGLRQYFVAREAERAVETWAWAVANRLIVVDPGHGGIDPGAIGPNGVKEKEVALAIGTKLTRYLSGAGAAVIMTREADVDLSDPGSGSFLEKKREDLARRVAYANERQAELYLSIHVNSFPSSRWWGAQTFYLRGSETGKALAQMIQEELVRVIGNDNRRKVKPEIYYVIQNTQMTSVIIEVGFISNPQEEALMADPIYQEKLAQAIYAGVVRYCGQVANTRVQSP